MVREIAYILGSSITNAANVKIIDATQRSLDPRSCCLRIGKKRLSTQ
jgi:hypothetical protein